MKASLQNVVQDLRFALRQLRRSPGFAIAAVLTLALGIGANTAMFSLLDQALLRSLPVRDPQQLVVLRGTGSVWEGHSSSWGTGDEDASFSYPMYRDLRDHDTAFTGLMATSPAEADIVRGNYARVVGAELVTGNYFDLLGVRAARGRTLMAADDGQPGTNPVVVLSYQFWQTGMNGDPSTVGSTLSINGQPFQVVGIAPPHFRSAVWGQTPSLFVPMSMTGTIRPGTAQRLTDHRDRWINIIGRLRPGETSATAEAQSAPLWHALRAEELKAIGTASPHFADEFLNRSRLLVQPAARGFSYSRSSYETPLLAIMTMAGLVLLIAVVNVAGLLLVRSAGRVQEFSMRYALGATGTRLMQQYLSEGLLIGVGAGLIGALLAPLATRVIVARFTDDNGSAPFSSAPDSRLLLFNFAVAVLVSVLFSLAPAFQVRSGALMNGMRGANSTGAGRVAQFRKLIVGLQIGLSLLLLFGAGLFVRTVERLRSQDVGFRTDHLLVFGISPRLAGYTPERLPALRDQLTQNLAAVPGVRSVGVTNDPALAGNSHGGDITLSNYIRKPEEEIHVDEANINPECFSAFGVPLLAGRTFTAADDLQHPLVALVNQDLAKRYYGAPGKAIGQRLVGNTQTHPAFDTEIVGVVQDFHQVSVRDPAQPSVFRPLAQAKGGDVNRELYFYLRAFTDPQSLENSVRKTVGGVNPQLAIDGLRTVEEQVDETLQNERLIALLASAFGLLAAALAGVGLYGVLAFVTTQRTREIGVRMALGATRFSVSKLVLSDVVRTALAGVAVAIPVAILLGRSLRSQLYGVSPADPLSLLAAVLLLCAVAMIAAILPARRAASIEPTEALRTE